MKLILAFVTMFFALTSKADKIMEIRLSKDNTAVLSSAVDSESVSNVIQQVQKLDANLKSGYPIYLFLYTPGGSIQDGLELIEFLKTVNRPVHTITMFSASMGFQIAQNLGKRYILATGVLMSHKAAGGFEGEFGDGMSQIDSRYGMWMDRIKEMDEQTVKRTKGKQTLKSYRNSYQNELWLTGAKAVAGGYADSIVKVSCDSSLNGTRKSSFRFFGLNINAYYSECPMNTSPLKIEIVVPTNKGTMTHIDFLSQGGVFAKDMKDMGKESSYSSSYGTDLFCTDPSLTISEVNKTLDNARKEIISKQKKVIKGY